MACDECHKRRIKCDHSLPCSRCIARHEECKFTREKRKRGKVPGKSKANGASTSNARLKAEEQGDGSIRPRGASGTGLNSESDAGMGALPSETWAAIRRLVEETTGRVAREQDRGASDTRATHNHMGQGSDEAVTVPSQSSPSQQDVHTNGGRPSMASAIPPMSGADSLASMPAPATNNGAQLGFENDWFSTLDPLQVPDGQDQFGNTFWPDRSFNVSLGDIGGAELGGYQMPMNFLRTYPPGQTPSISSSDHALKYPVLGPLMPFVGPELPETLMNNLLEFYFSSSFSTHLHPVCHHIHGYILRKASFMTRDTPRQCSPVLLASMLWVAALDDRAVESTISPSKRKKLCQYLCALTLKLLRPLIHVQFRGEESAPSNPAPPPHSLSNGRQGSKGAVFEDEGDERGLIGPAGSLDDVITYMHVASIISASEQKAASMRWYESFPFTTTLQLLILIIARWHAAFTLARELKLNQEMAVHEIHANPDDPTSPSIERAVNSFHSPGNASAPASLLRCTTDCVCQQMNPLDERNMVTEEQREERRRAWWLLYIMDRHLALCYNRPLALLDAECEDLLLPLDEESWQSGNIHTDSPKPDGCQCTASGRENKRLTFPTFACTGPSIFEFFLPLTIILGELIELNQAKNHPILGLRLQSRDVWDVSVAEIVRQLDCYEASLRNFGANAPIPPQSYNHPHLQHSTLDQAPHLTQSNAHDAISLNQTVIAYASHVLHVLHILLIGKWDPVTLFEDTDFWTSSSAFAAATSHAMAAAESVEQILLYDADVSFMPYFFGIQLLQGSFMLLLIVDRLQAEAGEGIIRACETVIRATEACVVTLSTDYQRKLRQVMHSALAQARGRPVNHDEVMFRRRAVLALYRWTRNGTGLAL